MSYQLSEKARNLAPYDPVEGQYRVRMDANESFLLPTEEDRLRMAEAAAQTALNRYPDPMAADLCAAFADLYGIRRELVTAGNGSDELISVIFTAFLEKGERVLTLSPDFSMYRFYAALAEAPCLSVEKGPDCRIDVDEVIRTIREQAVRLFIFSNPCNPTSVGLEREAVRRILRETDTLVVLDEAYMDFWDQSLLGEVEDYDRLIVLRTCSKALGLAALRIGFAVANPVLTGVIRAAKSPYNVDAITQAMAGTVLRNPTYREVYTDLILRSRDLLLEGMRRLQRDGLVESVCDSCTNFVYVRLPGAKEIHGQLAERGIIVRCFGEEHLRITAGTQSEDEELLASLRFLLRSRREAENARR